MGATRMLQFHFVIGANCPDMSRTLTILKVLSHVPPDRELGLDIESNYCTALLAILTGPKINLPATFLPDIAEELA